MASRKECLEILEYFILGKRSRIRDMVGYSLCHIYSLELF
jgi:hypothetical protein